MNEENQALMAMAAVAADICRSVRQLPQCDRLGVLAGALMAEAKEQGIPLADVLRFMQQAEKYLPASTAALLPAVKSCLESMMEKH